MADDLVNLELERQRRSSLMDSVGSVDDSPDDAARAMELSADTGIPASFIYGDVKGFESQHKAAMTSDIVKGNNYIQDYINQNAMHAKVSNDDWGNLHELSQNIQNYQATKPSGLAEHIKSAVKKLDDLFQFGGGWQRKDETWQPAPSFDDAMKNIMKEHPLGVASVLDYLAAGVKQVLTLPEEVTEGKVMSVDPETGMPSKEATEAGASTAMFMLGGLGTRFTRTTPLGLTPRGTVSDLGIPPAGMTPGEIWASHIAQFIKEREEFEAARARGEDPVPGPTYKTYADKIEPFVKAGEEPPPRIDPVVDKAYTEQAKASAQAFKEVERAYDASATAQRSPQAAEAFVKTHGPSTHAISAEGLRQVYGDEVPAPGDGKLGDVPGVVDNHELAASIGAPLEVDTASYLRNVPKELRKELEDHLVHTPGGLSVAEAKELGEAKEPEELPPVPKGHVRFFHGGDNPAGGGGRWVSENMQYARDYRPGQTLHYVDIPEAELEHVNKSYDDTGLAQRAPYVNFEATEAQAKRMKPVPADVKPAPSGSAEATLDAVRQGAGIKPPEPPTEPPSGKPPPAEGEAAHRAEPPFKTRYGSWAKKFQAELDGQAALIKRLNEMAVRRRQTKEWSEKAAAIRPQVAEELRSRPDVALDTFLRDGELDGDKYPKHYIDSDLLTAEQMAGIDSRFFKHDGQDPSEVASHFGYSSVDEMLGELRHAETVRRQQGVGHRQWFRDIVDNEVNARLEEEFGSLEENILKEVKEFVVSPTTLERVYAELENQARDQGVTPENYSKFTGMIEDLFNRTEVGQHSVKKYMNAAGSAGRGIEKELLKDKAIPAFSEKLRQVAALHMARLAMDLEKVQKREAKIIEQYGRLKKDDKRLTPEHRNFLHQILEQAGVKTGWLGDNLNKEITAGKHKNLEAFQQARHDAGFDMDVAGWLMDGFKFDPKKLSTTDYIDYVNSLEDIVADGRFENTVVSGNEKADTGFAFGEMKKQFDRFEIIPRAGEKEKRFPTLKGAYARLITVEFLLNRMQESDPHGPFNKWIVYPNSRADIMAEKLDKEIAQMLHENDSKYKTDLNRVHPNTLILNPLTGDPLVITHENVRAIVLYAGEKTAWNRFLRGYELNSAQAARWLIERTTREDWDWAEGRGKIEAHIRELDAARRRAAGYTPVQDLVLTPFEAHGKTYEGWYTPLVSHPDFLLTRSEIEAGKPNVLPEDRAARDALFDPEYLRAGMSRRWDKKRTETPRPLSLSVAESPAWMAKRVNDIARRDAVLQTAKFFLDARFKTEVTRRFGKEWTDLLQPYVQDMANRVNFDTANAAKVARALEFARKNLVIYEVGFKLSTFLLHVPSLAINSLMEVGPKAYLRAAQELFSKDELTSERMYRFVLQNSGELSRRIGKHYGMGITDVGETGIGAPRGIDRFKSYPSLRQVVADYGTRHLALGDIGFGLAMWLAKYNEALDGMVAERNVHPNEMHDRAVDIAEAAYRKAHGSTAASSRPEVLRSTTTLARWMTSFYVTFGHFLQRGGFEIPYRIADAFGMRFVGKLKKAEGSWKKVANLTFTYVIAMAALEMAVNGDPDDGKKNPVWRGLEHFVQYIANWFPVLGGIVRTGLRGGSPSTLLDTEYKVLTDPFRDLAKGPKALKGPQAGRTLRDLGQMFGSVSGLWPKQLNDLAALAEEISAGRKVDVGSGVLHGRIHPKRR